MLVTSPPAAARCTRVAQQDDTRYRVVSYIDGEPDCFAIYVRTLRRARQNAARLLRRPGANVESCVIERVAAPRPHPAFNVVHRDLDTHRDDGETVEMWTYE